MEYNYTLELYQALQFDLEKETDTDDLLDQLANAIEKIRLKIQELDIYIKANPLADASEEILYYKRVYPLFRADLIYFTKSYNLERTLQLTDRSDRISFLREELKLIPRFFRTNNAFYEYYKLNLTGLDAVYFSQASVSAHLMPESASMDFAVAATCAYTLAKFMALERLQIQLEDKLKAQEMPDREQDLRISQNRLKWTGETINLAEIAYALWLTGQINNGNASVTEIVEFLESRFQVKIGRPYKRWTEISRRKMASPTKFIDLMRQAIEKRIDDENRLS